MVRLSRTSDTAVAHINTPQMSRLWLENEENPHLPVQPPNMAAQHLEVFLYYQLIYTICLSDCNNRITIADKDNSAGG